jgi:DNA-nicking Smr family endonuclease
MSLGRPPSPEERQLWRLVATQAMPPRATPVRQVDAEQKQRGPVAPLDMRVEKRLNAGLVEPEARIDLHGHTLAHAETAALTFLKSAHAQGKRVVLVVTGKGNKPDGSTIRQQFARWLTWPAIEPFILAARPAAAKHGGDGAYYVLLRR